MIVTSNFIMTLNNEVRIGSVKMEMYLIRGAKINLK